MNRSVKNADCRRLTFLKEIIIDAETRSLETREKTKVMGVG